MALGFIGLSAGGHFQVSEMAASIGPAFIILACLVFLTFGGTLLSIMTLGRYIIPFFAALNSSQELAVSLHVACLSVARSPSSAIAKATPRPIPRPLPVTKATRPSSFPIIRLHIAR